MTNRRAEFINMVDHLTDVPQKIVQKEAQLASQSHIVSTIILKAKVVQ